MDKSQDKIITKMYAVVKQDPVMKFTKIHETWLVAKEEAERLAIKEGGQFMVLEVIGIVERAHAPLNWTYPGLFKKNDER